MDRYTVKLEMYVWADSVDQVKEAAKSIQNKQRDKYDNRWTITSIHDSPFGRLVDDKVYDIAEDLEL